MDELRRIIEDSEVLPLLYILIIHQNRESFGWNNNVKGVITFKVVVKWKILCSGFDEYLIASLID